MATDFQLSFADTAGTISFDTIERVEHVPASSFWNVHVTSGRTYAFDTPGRIAEAAAWVAFVRDAMVSTAGQVASAVTWGNDLEALEIPSDDPVDRVAPLPVQKAIVPGLTVAVH